MRAPHPQPVLGDPPRSSPAVEIGAGGRGRGLGPRHPVLVRGLARGLALMLAVAMASPATGCKTGPDLSADYAQTAGENYELALGEFGDEDWEEAIQYADFVRIRFPFSRYAVEAELLIARAEFEQGNYITSQDAFRQFAKLHPTHKHVRNGWVSYMAAVSAYMNGPQGFFLLPPDYQRDQSRLREALVELEYFFDHYSDTSSTENALELRDEINRRLLEHELYVARFYLDRDKPEAAIGRLESAHAQYPGIGLDAEVLFLLGLTYLRMEEVELSRSIFSELQSQHPRHHHGKQARIYLRYIYDTYGPADPSRKRPDRKRPVPVPPPEPKNRERPEHPELAAPATVEPPPGTQPPPPAKRKLPKKAAEPEVEDPEAEDPEAEDPEAEDPEAEDPEAEDPEAPQSKLPPAESAEDPSSP